MKRNTVCLVAALAALLSWVMPANSGPSVAPGDCKYPEWVPTEILDIGPYTYTCKTYFLGILVHTSTVTCQRSTRTTPGHYKCTSTPSASVDCIGGVNNVIETTQPYKARCKSSTGLSIEVGGVQIGIDWWEAVCEKDGPAINAVKTTDSSVPCNDAEDDDGSNTEAEPDQSSGD